jgi:hypothetical protein
MVSEDRTLQRLLESFFESNDSPATDSAQRHDALSEKSPDPGKSPEIEVRPSESVLWSGRAGLFNTDILIVTTRRVIFKRGSAWTVLRLSEIDTVDVSQTQLLVTTRGTTHTVDFRKKKIANEAARVIFENMLRQ